MTGIASCQCSQCGSTDFKRVDDEMLRCAHCDSLFRMRAGAGRIGTKVVIGKGANVVFGERAKVVIHGELIVENGAHVQFLGAIEIIEASSTERVAAAREELERVIK